MELSFRVSLRINCKQMIKDAILNDDESELLRIAKALSRGEYIFDDESEFSIDRSKVRIPLEFKVNTHICF